jgi:hypothetical protein
MTTDFNINVYELLLPLQCNFILEKDTETNRYSITLTDFNNLKKGQTLTNSVYGNTIEECLIRFSESCITKYKFIDQNQSNQ